MGFIILIGKVNEICVELEVKIFYLLLYGVFCGMFFCFYCVFNKEWCKFYFLWFDIYCVKFYDM